MDHLRIRFVIPFTARNRPLKKSPERKIAVLDAYEEECREMCELLEQQHYKAIPLHSLAELEVCLEINDCMSVLMDIDSVSIDNRTIRELTIRHPEAYFLCTSKDRFHPDLKDAICYHIYACLNKPVDPDELFYWLRSIDEDDADPKYNHKM
jgi:DNA-binding NtrC family response regulator